MIWLFGPPFDDDAFYANGIVTSYCAQPREHHTVATDWKIQFISRFADAFDPEPSLLFARMAMFVLSNDQQPQCVQTISKVRGRIRQQMKSIFT